MAPPSRHRPVSPTQGPPSLGLCAGFRAASGPCAGSGGPPPGGAARSAGDFRGHSCGCREVGPVGTCRQGWAGFAVEGPLSGTTGGSSPAQLGQRRRRGWGARVDKCAGKATPCGSPDPGLPASPATLTLQTSPALHASLGPVTAEATDPAPPPHLPPLPGRHPEAPPPTPSPTTLRSMPLPCARPCSATALQATVTSQGPGRAGTLVQSFPPARRPQ